MINFILHILLICLFSSRCVYLHKCDDQVGCCSSQKQHCMAMEQKVVFKYFYNLSSDKRQSRVVRLEFVNDTKCQCRELDNIHHHSLAELNSRQSIINGKPGNQLNGSPSNGNQLSNLSNGNYLADSPMNGNQINQPDHFRLSANELGSFAPVQHQNAMRSTELNDRSTRFTTKDRQPDGQPSGYASRTDQFIVSSLPAVHQPDPVIDSYSRYEPWKDFNNLVLPDDLSNVKTNERPAYWNNKKFNGKLTVQNLFDCRSQTKLCPEPYTTIQSRDPQHNNSCYCGCKSRSVNCIKVMNGLRRLDNQQIQCVLTGQCLLPECLYTNDDYRFNKNTGHCPTREEVLGIY